MGVRTAAAKLGFRLSAATWNRKICSSSSRLLQYTRRCNSSLATITDTTAIVDKQSSNLYLCIDERTTYSSNHEYADLVIRPIRFDTYVGDDDEELREDAAYRFSDFRDIMEKDRDDDSLKVMFNRMVAAQTKIISSGSKIFFTVGQTIPKDVGWVDPSIHPVKFHVSSQTETRIKSFSTPKFDMRWGAIDGKLYCFDKSSSGSSRCFEVLDPETEDTEWQQHLSEPPFIRTDGATDDYNVLFLNESRKILGWEDNVRGVFWFDTTKPENGWIESPSSLGDSIPFIGQHDTRFVIRDNHPKLGDFNLMFNHESYDEPYVVHAYIISDKCDSFQPIHEPVSLPKSYNCRQSESRFVHLGSKKFCLILHYSWWDITVLTFDYKVIVTDETKDSEPTIEVKTRLLGSRSFSYSRKSEDTETSMIGAFLF